MKKFMAFLMAFALCLVCFGTYGFADLATEDASHDHAGVVHAADDDMLFIRKNKSSYFYEDGILTIKLVLGPSRISGDFSGKIFIGITAEKEDVLDVDAVGTSDVSGRLLGEYVYDVEAYSEKEIRVTYKISGADAGDSFCSTSGVTIEIPVSRYFSETTSDRKVTVKVASDNMAVDTLSNSMTVYICEHKNTYTKTQEATCQEEGLEEEICTLCKGVVSSEVIEIDEWDPNHRFDFSKPTNTSKDDYEAPTCTTRGFGFFRCQDCGTIEKVELDKLEHDLGERYLRGGVYYQTCLVCKKEQKAANQCDHNTDNYVKLYDIEKATCTTRGTAMYGCPSCDQTEERTENLAEHTWNAGTVTKVATCTTTGTKKLTCLVCDRTSTETIARLDHEWGAWALTEEASCVEEGTETRVCSKCNGKDTRAVAGTGHEYGAWVVTVPASCVANGTETRTCSLCKEKDTRVLDMVAHTWSAWQTVQEATCVAQGSEKHTCSVCYKEETRVIGIVAENHNFSEWKTVTAKTCLTDGVKSHTCTLCNVEISEVDECVGHVLGDAVVEKKYSTKTCGVCGYKEVTKTVKNGVEKTLTTAASGSLKITGADAAKNYVFELSAPTMEKETYYRENLTFSPAQITNLELLIGEEDAAFNSFMTLSLSLAPSLSDYEVKLYRLVNGAIYPIYEFDRKDGEVIIPGNEIIGADVIFVEQGAEQKANLLVPILVTVVTLAIAGGAVYFFLVKNKKEELF